jgi:hypothetical protein
MPHYSTDRFWIAAAQANLSMALCFACFYFSAKASAANTSHRWRWLSISIISLAGSIFAYETSAPLFILIPLLLYLRLHRLRDSLQIVATSFVAIALILILKYSLRTYVSFDRRFDFRRHLGSNIRTALTRFINFNYGAFSFGLPKLAWRLFRERPDQSVALLAAAIGVAIATYLWVIARRPSEDITLRHNWVILFITGITVYCLGYMLFFPVSAFDVTPTGVDNRVMIAMTSGTAMALVGFVGMIVSYLSRGWMRDGFLVLGLAFLCSCGFIVISGEGAYWRDASQMQGKILRNIKGYFPLLPDGTILLLDDVCPYNGPAAVFETDWDVSGALQILYRNPTLAGDVITPRVSVQPDRLVTSIYGKEHFYHYGDNLLLYRVERRQTCELKDSLSATTCLDSGNWKPGTCRPGNEGLGVPIF